MTFFIFMPMKQTYLILLSLFISILGMSCHKEHVVLSGDNKLLSLSVANELYPNTISDNSSANVVIPHTLNRTNLTASFSISDQASATVNNAPQIGTITADFTKPITMAIKAANGNISNWTINVQTDAEYFGLGESVNAERSLNRNYNWYVDQGTSGTYSDINCGPAAVTMALKWSDSTFNRTAEDARNTFRASGGWWYTTDVVNYLNMYGIEWAYIPLPDNYQSLKRCIDAGEVAILCLDNYYLTYNDNDVQHVGKFYKVGAPDSGHFIVVKGYKQVDKEFYFEVYDPWSIGATYAIDKQLKGQNRYYSSNDLEKATGVWWDYAIVVAPKGKVVNNLNVKTYGLSSPIPAQKGK